MVAGEAIEWVVNIEPGDIPVNATEIQLAAYTYGGTVEVHGRFGSPPVEDDYDCQASGEYAKCVIETPQVGTYYFTIMPEVTDQIMCLYSNYDTPTSSHGRLRVCKEDGLAKNKLCDLFGNPVQLRGMSTHGIQWFPWHSDGDGCYNNKMMDLLAREWNVDVLRVSMYPSTWESDYQSDPATYHKMVDNFIAAAIERDLYVIIDWHMLAPGDPNDSMYIAPFSDPPAGCDELSKVECYFKHFLETWSYNSNIIYEIANEPNMNCDVEDDPNCSYDDNDDHVSWAELQVYSQNVGEYIRSFYAGKHAIIIVPTTNWCSLGISQFYWDDEVEAINEIIANPVVIDGSSDNILYSVHLYAMSHIAPYGIYNSLEPWNHKVYSNALVQAGTAPHNRLPLFVTEFGSQHDDGTAYPMIEFEEHADTAMAIINDNLISWTSWNFSDNTLSNAVWEAGTCNDIVVAGELIDEDVWETLLKPSGEYILGKLRETSNEAYFFFPFNCAQAPAWDDGTSFVKGDKVVHDYNGQGKKLYELIYTAADPGWEPGNPVLADVWSVMRSCSALPGCGVAHLWNSGSMYLEGDRVVHNYAGQGAKLYKVIHLHADPGWEPGNPTLWAVWEEVDNCE